MLEGLLRVRAVDSSEYAGYVLVHRTLSNASLMLKFLDDVEAEGEGEAQDERGGARPLLSAEHLLSLFSEKTPSFKAKFATYRFFKRRGFHVRTGINYGVDFTLYRALPSACHSEFCVVVVDNITTPERKPEPTSSCLLSDDRTTSRLSHEAAHGETQMPQSEPDADSDPAAGGVAWSQVFALTRMMPVSENTGMAAYSASVVS